MYEFCSYINMDILPCIYYLQDFFSKFYLPGVVCSTVYCHLTCCVHTC